MLVFTSEAEKLNLLFGGLFTLEFRSPSAGCCELGEFMWNKVFWILLGASNSLVSEPLHYVDDDDNLYDNTEYQLGSGFGLNNRSEPRKSRWNSGFKAWIPPGFFGFRAIIQLKFSLAQIAKISQMAKMTDEWW